MIFLKHMDVVWFCLHKTSAVIAGIEVLFKCILVSFNPFNMLWHKLIIFFHRNKILFWDTDTLNFTLKHVISLTS